MRKCVREDYTKRSTECAWLPAGSPASTCRNLQKLAFLLCVGTAAATGISGGYVCSMQYAVCSNDHNALSWLLHFLNVL